MRFALEMYCWWFTVLESCRENSPCSDPCHPSSELCREPFAAPAADSNLARLRSKWKVFIMWSQVSLAKNKVWQLCLSVSWTRGARCKGLLLNGFLKPGDGLRLAPSILRIAAVWQGLSETCYVHQQLHVMLLRAVLGLEDSVWDVVREGRPLPRGILSTELELPSSWRAPLLPPLPQSHLQHPQSHTWHLRKCCLA